MFEIQVPIYTCNFKLSCLYQYPFLVTCQYNFICGIHLAEIVSDFKMKFTHDSDMHTEYYRAAINFKRFMYARLAMPVTVARRQNIFHRLCASKTFLSQPKNCLINIAFQTHKLPSINLKQGRIHDLKIEGAPV